MVGERRVRLAALQLLAVAWLGCARPAPSRIELQTAAAKQPPDGGERVLRSICAGCHTGAVPSRPDLSRPMPSSALAAQALRAVLAREMPPASVDLSEDLRAQLIGYLCRRADRGAAYCGWVASRDATEIPVRSGSTFLQAIKRVASAVISEDLRSLVFVQSRARATRMVRTPSIVAVSIAVAAAACQARGPQPRAALDTCVQRVLELGTSRARPPAGSPGAPPR